jgi:hypothetical protein
MEGKESWCTCDQTLNCPALTEWDAFPPMDESACERVALSVVNVCERY